MQQEKNALKWFMQMVKTGAMNPLNPDMSLVPDDILSQLHCKLWPNGEILPTHAAARVSNYLFIACKIVMQMPQGDGLSKPFNVSALEIILAQEKFLILAGLETLKRAGLLEYQTKGSWQTRDSGIVISDVRPQSAGIVRPLLYGMVLHCN